MKQTPMCCWHFFNKHLPKEEGGGQNHFSTKKKKKDIVSFLNSGYVCGFFLFRFVILQHLLSKRHVEFKVKTAFLHEVPSDSLQSSKCYQSLRN